MDRGVDNNCNNNASSSFLTLSFFIAFAYYFNTCTKTMTDESTTSAPAKGDEKMEQDDSKGAVTTATVEVVEIRSPSPSISVSLLLFWVLPIMLLTFCSHLAFDKDKAFQLHIPEDRKVSVDLTAGAASMDRKPKKKPSSTPTTKKKMSRPSSPRPSPLPSAYPTWPTSYRATIDTIQKRNRKVPRIGTTSSDEKKNNNNNPGTKETSSPDANKNKASKSTKPRTSSTRSTDSTGRDPARQQYEERIDEYRDDYEADPNNVLKAIKLADALRLYDVTYHDGGTKQQESIATYDRAIEQTIVKRKQMVEAGEDTTKASPGTSARNVREEVMVDYSQKSVDGLLCAMYTALGKVYFMANM